MTSISSARTHFATQDQVNQSVYHRAGVERFYRSTQLTQVEAIVLLKYSQAFIGLDVLDLGVGTGRTSLYLAPLARRYEGIDYSPIMVERTRAQLPGVSVLLADMRDLSMFADNQFDFIFGPNNVIDAVSHEDRLRSLAEFRRVLRLGGIMALSSHNREFYRAMSGPRLKLTCNPVNQAIRTIAWVRQWSNHARVGRMRKSEIEYALLNDEGHHYACLHYYIDQRTQRSQFSALGFSTLAVMDCDGNSVSERERTAISPALTYVEVLDCK